MAIARLSGVDLYYEETGEGVPLVRSHEFGGDHHSWEPQVRYFARGYHVVTSTCTWRSFSPPLSAGAGPGGRHRQRAPKEASCDIGSR